MFKKLHLNNGLTLVTERMQTVRSVSLGIWVRVGARDEAPEIGGISHFLEHMFFKGTKKRTAHDIAIDIDSIGGELNAFTSKESTTFYIKVLDEHLDKGAELLTDIIMNSTFPEDELEREKGVVKEEIKMVEDTPDEYIHDLFSHHVWGDLGLGQPVLGKRETVRSFSRDNITDHVKKYYGVHNTIVSCVGNFDEQVLLDVLNKDLGKLRKGQKSPDLITPAFLPVTHVHHKDLAEVHICLGIQGIPQSSKERFSLSLLNTLFGGGLSSRLFQEIREKRGLAYSVYSFLSSYLDTGIWGVYAGTGKDNAAEVIERTVAELKRLPHTVTEAELKRAKDQLKGSLVLGLESTSRRMQNIATQEIYYGRYHSPREVIEAIDNVTLAESREIAERLILADGIAMTVLGPIHKSELPAVN